MSATAIVTTIVSAASPSFAPSNAPSTAATSPSASATSRNQYDNGPLHTLSTVLPGFLIAFICVISIFLVCGIFHGRRRRALLLSHMPSAPPQPTEILHAHARTRRRKKRMTKPKLWDVAIKGTSWDWDIERMKPVAVELLAPPRPTASHADDTRRANWLFPTFAHSHKPQEAQPSMPQARVTVLLSMPAQDRAADVHSREYVIGTTHLPFNLEEPPLRIIPLPFQVGEDPGAAKVERFLQY